MISTAEHEKIQRALKTKEGCQTLKAEVESAFRLAMGKLPPNIDTIERIVTIAEYALMELHIVRTLEERY